MCFPWKYIHFELDYTRQRQYKYKNKNGKKLIINKEMVWIIQVATSFSSGK